MVSRKSTIHDWTYFTHIPERNYLHVVRINHVKFMEDAKLLTILAVNLSNTVKCFTKHETLIRKMHRFAHARRIEELRLKLIQYYWIAGTRSNTERNNIYHTTIR